MWNLETRYCIFRALANGCLDFLLILLFEQPLEISSVYENKISKKRIFCHCLAVFIAGSASTLFFNSDLNLSGEKGGGSKHNVVVITYVIQKMGGFFSVGYMKRK